jgi:hypothetical protein
VYFSGHTITPEAKRIPPPEERPKFTPELSAPPKSPRGPGYNQYDHFRRATRDMEFNAGQPLLIRHRTKMGEIGSLYRVCVVKKAVKVPRTTENAYFVDLYLKVSEDSVTFRISPLEAVLKISERDISAYLVNVEVNDGIIVCKPGGLPFNIIS